MAYDNVRHYAVNAINDIIPLGRETCEEVVNYTLTLSESEIQSHLLDLLGASEDSFKLISKFIELKSAEDKAMLRAELKPNGSVSNAQSQVISKDNHRLSAWNKPTPAPQRNSKNRLSDNKHSATLSELADMRPSNKLTANQAKKTKKKNISNLADIEAVLHDLEVERTKQSTDVERNNTVKRVCNCMATKHPLFEVAPNCLNCGKIICSKEGLQPCSFCGNELLSGAEKLEIIRILKSEKDLLETKQSNPVNKSVQEKPSKLAPKKIKYAMTPGQNLWKAQDDALRIVEERAKKQREAEAEQKKRLEELEEQKLELEHYSRKKDMNSDLIEAQERLETLLHFQETGAERSKIIDNASDFEMPGISSGSIWLSPVERALQLKKQQKQLRKIEAQDKARSGRSKKVVEMVIRDGKVKMVEKQVLDDDAGKEDKEINDLEHTIRSDKNGIEASLTKNRWDYEKEQDKWERPIYEYEGNHASKGGDAPTTMKNRVQQNVVDNAELVAAMYS